MISRPTAPKIRVRLRKKALLESAVGEHPGGRAGREDHHRAEGEQAQRRREQQVVFGRGAAARAASSPSSRRGRRRGAATALSAAPRRSGGIARRAPRSRGTRRSSRRPGESRTTSPGRAAAAAAAQPSQVTAAVEVDPRRRRRARAPAEVGGLTDQVGGRAALGHRLGERREVLALDAAAEDDVDAAVECSDAVGRRADVGRLGVVDEERAADLGDRLEAVRDAGEAAQPLGDGVAGDAHRERRGRGGHRVGDVVVADQAQLGGVDQRLAVAEDRALRRA